jgi:hypothetical protein
MSETSKNPGMSEARAAWGGAAPSEVTSSAFAGRFGHWAFEAQKAPVKVVNAKTGNVLGYFVAAAEFAEYQRLRGMPRSVWASELSPDLLEELLKPVEPYTHELDELLRK